MSFLEQKIDVDKVIAEINRLRTEGDVNNTSDRYRYATLMSINEMLYRKQSNKTLFKNIRELPYNILIIASLMDLRNKKRVNIVEEFANLLWIEETNRIKTGWIITNGYVQYKIIDKLKEKPEYVSDKFNANEMEKQTRKWFDNIVLNLFIQASVIMGEKISLSDARYIYNIVVKQIREIKSDKVSVGS